MKHHIFFTILFLIIVILISVVIQYYNTQSFTVNDDFDITYYVITMGQPERLENIKKQQAKINAKIEKFDAVVIEQSKEALDAIKDPVLSEGWKTDFPAGFRRRINETGCYMSHYGIYKKIKEDNKKGVTVILEDDFMIIDDDFENKVQKAVKETMQNIDYYILYIHNLTGNIGEQVAENVCKIDNGRTFWGTQAYLVNNASVDKILNVTSTLDEQIDEKLAKCMKNGELSVYTFCPQLTAEDKTIFTTIHLY